MKRFYPILCIVLWSCSRDNVNLSQNERDPTEKSAPKCELTRIGHKYSLILPPAAARGLSEEILAAHKATEKWIDGEEFIHFPVYAYINCPGESVIVSDEYLIINKDKKWSKLEGPFASAIRNCVFQFPKADHKNKDWESVRKQMMDKLEAIDK